jgi:hypothetical protein
MAVFFCTSFLPVTAGFFGALGSYCILHKFKYVYFGPTGTGGWGKPSLGGIVSIW